MESMALQNGFSLAASTCLSDEAQEYVVRLQVSTAEGLSAATASCRVATTRHPGSTSITVGIEHVYIDKRYRWAELEEALVSAIVGQVIQRASCHRSRVVRLSVDSWPEPGVAQTVQRYVENDLFDWKKRRAGVQLRGRLLV